MHTANFSGTEMILTPERQRRIKEAITQAQGILNKELAHAPDLQDQKMIDDYRRSIEKNNTYLLPFLQDAINEANKLLIKLPKPQIFTYFAPEGCPTVCVSVTVLATGKQATMYAGSTPDCINYVNRAHEAAIKAEIKNLFTDASIGQLRFYRLRAEPEDVMIRIIKEDADQFEFDVFLKNTYYPRHADLGALVNYIVSVKREIEEREVNKSFD